MSFVVGDSLVIVMARQRRRWSKLHIVQTASRVDARSLAASSLINPAELRQIQLMGRCVAVRDHHFKVRSSPPRAWGCSEIGGW
jgi:hypothetical protein